jgi:hypothetical protein
MNSLTEVMPVQPRPLSGGTHLIVMCHLWPSLDLCDQTRLAFGLAAQTVMRRMSI